MPTLSTYSSREASITIGWPGFRASISIAARQMGGAVYAVIRPSSTKFAEALIRPSFQSQFVSDKKANSRFTQLESLIHIKRPLITATMAMTRHVRSLRN